MARKTVISPLSNPRLPKEQSLTPLASLASYALVGTQQKSSVEPHAMVQVFSRGQSERKRTRASNKFSGDLSWEVSRLRKEELLEGCL